MADISKIERKGILYNIKDTTARNLLQQKYTVPIGGIPKEDLSLEVLNLLQAAKTAIQNYTETDPTVPAWAKAVNKPTYTAQEVGALPSTTHIPVDPVNADWNASSGLALILNKPALFSGDYNDLINKPAIPSGYDDTVLSGRITALENAGFITQESDPTVPSWAKASTKPSYTASEVGALPADTVIPVIPTNVSSFVNDAGYLTQHLDISGKANISDLAAVATSGSYNDLSDTPDVPIAISVNEQSFVMNQFHAFVIPDYYTKTLIDNAGYVTSSDVADAVADLVDSAPSTLNTLNELAAALGDDPNFATTVANQIGLKANASDVYTKSEIDNAGYLTLHQSLSDYYTKSQVDNLTEKTLTRGDGKLLYNGLTIDTAIANVGISSSNNLLNNGFNMAIRSNSSNPFFGLKEGNNLWYALAASNYFYFGPTSAKALRLDQDGNGVFQTGSVTANSFIKKNGTSSLFLKADGSVDSNVYLTSHLDISGKANTSDLAEVATSGSYNDLTDKPTIPSAYNDTALSNRVTALENAGFLTSETDPNVPAWAKAATKPSYTASEVGALPDTTVIPTATSQLTNDSGFLTTHQDISGKQDTLTAGNGIAIDANDTIRTTGIPFGRCDSTSTATVFTATVPGIYKLEDGVCAMIENGVVTSASGFTLNVNGLGAKPCYTNLAAATRDTTLFNVAYTMLFVYDEERVSGGCWVCYRGYDANTNTIGYQVRSNSMSLPASQKFYRYRLLFTSADGTHYVPANTSSSTNATSSRTVNQTPIDPFGHIVYYGTTAAVEANARPSASALWVIYTLSLGYSFNRTGAALTLDDWAPVYLKCAPQADGSAIIDEDTPYVQALPTTADGKIYIFLGVAYNATSIELLNNHPVYYHDGTGIRIWTGKNIPSKTSELTNDSNFVQSTSLATVATSGSYNDLTNTPTIPAAITVDSTITQNGTNPVQGGAIYSALDGKADKTFVINIEDNGNDGYTCDKTNAEIYAAWQAGRHLIAIYPDRTYYLASTPTATNVDFITNIYDEENTIQHFHIYTTNGTQEVSFYDVTLLHDSAPCADITSTDITNWNNKQPALVSGTNIKTINNHSLLGSGNLTANDIGALPSTTTIPTVPTNVSSFTNDAGYLTSHLDISGKADKSEMSVSTSNDTTTITLKSGTSATVINQHNVVIGKLLNGNFYSGVYVSQLGDWHFSDTAETGNSKKLYVDVVNKLLYKYEDSYVSITGDFVTTDIYNNDILDLWDNLVPQTRTINSKALSNDITLTASDVNAQEVLISGTNIKTINSQSLLGEGNLTIASGSDGVGIASVVQTTTSNTSGGNNIITVTKTDGSSSTFTVKNGVDGVNGVSLGEIALTQETGDSTSSVMSQAAVTESIELSIQSTKSRLVVDPTKAIYTTSTTDSNATSMNTYLFDEIRKLDVVYRVAYGWNSVNYYSSGNLCSIYIDSNNFIRWRVDSYACYAEIKVNGTYLLQNSHTINSGSPQLNSRTQIAAVIDLILNKMIIYGVDSGSMSIIYSYDISSYDISSFSGKQAKIITTIFSYNRSYYGVYVRVNKFLGLEDDLTRTIYASGYNAFPTYQKAPLFGYNNLVNGLTLGGTVTQTITSTHKIISATNASGYFALAPKTSKSVSYPNLFWTLNIKLLSGSISIGRSAANAIGGVYIYDSNMNQVSTIELGNTYLMLVGALTKETAYAFSYALSVSGTFELEVWNPNLFNIQTLNICVDTWDGEYFTGTIPFKASPMFASTTAVGSILISNGNILMWNGSVWKQINNS